MHSFLICFVWCSNLLFISFQFFSAYLVSFLPSSLMSLISFLFSSIIFFISTINWSLISSIKSLNSDLDIFKDESSMESVWQPLSSLTLLRPRISTNALSSLQPIKQFPLLSETHPTEFLFDISFLHSATCHVPLFDELVKGVLFDTVSHCSKIPLKYLNTA